MVIYSGFSHQKWWFIVDLAIKNGPFIVDLAIKNGPFIVDLAIKNGDL